MRNFFISVFLPILLATLFSACTYQLDEENFVPLAEEPAVEVSRLDLMNVADTFQLFARSTLLTYKIAAKNADTVSVSVYVDGRWRHNAPSTHGSFTLRASDYEDGYHTIRLDFITNSGTGSIADKLGGEMVKWSREWVFFLERKPAEPLEILNIYPKDGRLVVEWEKSTTATEKKLSFQCGYWGPEWSYTISNPNQTQLTDTIYIGGEVKVSLENISIDSDNYSPITSKDTSFALPKIKTFSSDGYGNVQLSWDKPVFFKSFGEYKIYHGEELISSSNDINDTTAVTGSIPFLFSKQLTLVTISKNRTQLEWGEEVKGTTKTNVRVGEEHPWFMDNLLHSYHQPDYGFQLNSRGVFVLHKDSVVRDVPGIALDSYFDAAVSSDGSLFFVSNNQIQKLNRAGEAEVVLDLGELNGELFFPRRFSLGKDRYLCFANMNGPSSIFTPGAPAGRVYIYDLAEQVIVSEVVVPEEESRVISTRQSMDGKYLAIQYQYRTEIHTLSDGQVQSTISLPNWNVTLFFSSKNSHQLILYDYKEVEVYDMETGVSLKNAVETPYPLENINYDPVSGYLGGEQGDYYYVLNPTSGNVVRKILINRSTNAFNFYGGSLYAYFNKLDLKLD